METRPKRGQKVVREHVREEYSPAAGEDVGRFRTRPDLVDEAEEMVPKMEEKYQHVKDNVKDAGSTMMEKGSDMVHSVANAGSNLMHKISDVGHDAWNAVTGDNSDVERFPRGTQRVEERHEVRRSSHADYDPNNEFDELHP